MYFCHKSITEIDLTMSVRRKKWQKRGPKQTKDTRSINVFSEQESTLLLSLPLPESRKRSHFCFREASDRHHPHSQHTHCIIFLQKVFHRQCACAVIRTQLLLPPRLPLLISFREASSYRTPPSHERNMNFLEGRRLGINWWHELWWKRKFRRFQVFVSFAPSGEQKW